MPSGWIIEFEEIEHELSIINRRAENSKYRLLKRKVGRFHDGQRDRLLPSSSSCTSLKTQPSAAMIAEALSQTHRGSTHRSSTASNSHHRRSIRRRGSHRTHSRQSSIHSDSIRRAFQSIQKVPEALKHLKAFVPKQNISFEDRLAEFNGDQTSPNATAQEAAPEDLFRDLLSPAKPQSAAAPSQQSVVTSIQPRSKPSHRLEASLEVFVDHGLLPRPEVCAERFRSGYPAYNMKNMDDTQRDLYAFAMQLDRRHKSQAKNIGRERVAAYRRARKYHREILTRAAEDAKIKSKSRVK